jgi:hypothetical protein
MDLGAFKTDNEIYLLAIPRGADSMTWVETRSDHALIFCDTVLKGRNELLASFPVGDHNGAPDPITMEITLGRSLVVMRVQGQKFKVIGLFEHRAGRSRNLVPEVTGRCAEKCSYGQNLGQ